MAPSRAASRPSVFALIRAVRLLQETDCGYDLASGDTDLPDQAVTHQGKRRELGGSVDGSDGLCQFLLAEAIEGGREFRDLTSSRNERRMAAFQVPRPMMFIWDSK